MSSSSSSSIANQICVVTGGSGFVGRRLVELLVERGAKRVISFDIREPMTKSKPEFNMLKPEDEAKVTYVLGDISNFESVVNAFHGADAVFHIAAAVGPFPADHLFKKVNVVGTQNVINACKSLKIKRLVAASTPSIFFDGNSISGKAPKELAIVKPGHFLARYAETKAVAEKLVRESLSKELLTINVAPHQVYGPRDGLFLVRIFFLGTLQLNTKGLTRMIVNTIYSQISWQQKIVRCVLLLRPYIFFWQK
jgi:sterol-4alpha-carboxylate 3-dehydrogenase (decarboxylating)